MNKSIVLGPIFQIMTQKSGQPSIMGADRFSIYCFNYF